MMQQLVVRISSERKVLLEALASRQDRTVSELTREALDYWLKEKTDGADGENFLLSLAQVGKGVKGKKSKDLSGNYKKVLYD